MNNMKTEYKYNEDDDDRGVLEEGKELMEECRQWPPLSDDALLEMLRTIDRQVCTANGHNGTLEVQWWGDLDYWAESSCHLYSTRSNWSRLMMNVVPRLRDLLQDKKDVEQGRVEGETQSQWLVDESKVGLIINALEAAVEHTAENVARHDEELGRTTRKNKYWGEVLDQDLANTKEALAFLKNHAGYQFLQSTTENTEHTE